jgi:hypothetical protein
LNSPGITKISYRLGLGAQNLNSSHNHIGAVKLKNFTADYQSMKLNIITEEKNRTWPKSQNAEMSKRS